MPLIRSLFIETNPIPVKTALSLMGKCSGDLRLPMTPMAEGNLKKLKSSDARVRSAQNLMALGIIVCGVGGRMGGAVVRAIRQSANFKIGRRHR